MKTYCYAFALSNNQRLVFEGYYIHVVVLKDYVGVMRALKYASSYPEEDGT